MSLRNVTIGADPELFIINKNTGKVVSSIGLIPGVKGAPYTSDDMPQGFGLETDNILAEFNIPPVTNVEGFINNINYMHNYIRNFIQNINPELDIKCSASEIVDEDQLQSAEANAFFCEPDFNAYTECENDRPKVPTNGLRSAGFHIHWGYHRPNVDTSLEIVKLCDAFIGVPSIILDPDTRRRNIYGKAGSFRLTPYGVEYRSLSSFMQGSPELLKAVWSGIERVKKEVDYRTVDIHRHSSIIRECINNSDVELAKRICKAFKIEYV
jgi:hypothetical protein